MSCLLPRKIRQKESPLVGTQDSKLICQRKGFYIALLWFGAVFFNACSHHELLVDSFPPAGDIHVTLPSGETKTIGAGPVRLNTSEYRKFPFVFLSAQKEGKSSGLILLPREFFDQVGEVQIPLRSAPNLFGSGRIEWNDALLAQVLQAQNYIHKKNFDEAQNILVNLTGQYPQSATLWSLLGSSYYLANKKIKALEAYEKALALNPSATDVQRLVEQLRKE